MAFCSECGNNIGTDKFCSECGAASKTKDAKDNSPKTEGGFLDEMMLEGYASMKIGWDSVGGTLYVSKRGLLFKTNPKSLTNRNKEFYIEGSSIITVYKSGLMGFCVVTDDKKYRFFGRKAELWIKNISSLIRTKVETPNKVEREVVQKNKKKETVPVDKASDNKAETIAEDKSYVPKKESVKIKTEYYWYAGVIVVLIGYFVYLFPSACTCADLSNNSPMTKDYSYSQANDRDFLRSEVKSHISLAKRCAKRFGDMTEFEKEIMKGALSLDQIPYRRTIRNAQNECY